MSAKNKKVILRIFLLVFITINIGFLFYNINEYRSKHSNEGQNITIEASGNNEQTNNDDGIIKESNENNNNLVEGQVNNDSIIEDKNAFEDYEYKLFYGEWEVNKIIGKHLVYPPDSEIAEAYIGAKIEFLEDVIYIEGQADRINPQYSIAIIPITNPKHSYIDKMPSLEEIGITGDYFTYIYVNILEGDNSSFLGDEFYIKDDNTLIAFYNDVYYELKRVSHIEDAEIAEVHL